MAFGKQQGAPASRLSARIASTTKSATEVVALKPTAYDARRQADILAKAATDEADARYMKTAVIGCLIVLAVVALYSLGSMYFAAPAPGRLRP